jgi:nucleoside-diphosphate-sugar epimerase
LQKGHKAARAVFIAVRGEVSDVLTGEKILITGVAGQIGYPLAEYLARDNEVWGLSRLRDDAVIAQVKSVGAVPYPCDLGKPDFSRLPEDFTYVLHLAVLSSGLDYDGDITVNAEGTGFLLQHCRRAKGALVMSTHSVYKPQEDPWHVFVESDPLGVNLSAGPTYSVSKIAQEAVSRYCAKALDLPVMVARMNTSYGPNGGLPTNHMDAVAAGKPVSTKWDPCPYSPIYQDDINEQVASLLDAASVPATIVNWAGDEPVSVQEWTAYMGELTGREPAVIVQEVPGSLRGLVADVSRRKAITGPCKVRWRQGLQLTWEAR